MELDGDSAKQGIEPALEDPHPRIRETAARLLNRLAGFSIQAKNERLTAATGSSPRAQSATLQLLLADNPPVEMTAELVQAKTTELEQLSEAAAIVSKACTKSQTAALNVLSLVLAERVTATVDLTLQAMQGIEDGDAIEVIRLGMRSQEKQFRASACEALNGLENRRVGRTLASIIESPGRNKPTYFQGLDHVLDWCLIRKDPWLNQCASACREALAA
jgi:hypothetical protein